MADYSKEEFERLIQSYNEQMMAFHRAHPNNEEPIPGDSVAVPRPVPGDNELNNGEETVEQPAEDPATPDDNEPDMPPESPYSMPSDEDYAMSPDEDYAMSPDEEDPLYPIETDEIPADEIPEDYNMPDEETRPSEDSVPAEPPLPEEIRNDTGYLQVRVTTENQAIPLEGAYVLISRAENGNVYLERALSTDEDGLTPIIALPTKARDLSLEPGNTKPYSSYTVEVSNPGYYPERFVDLPVYGGVTSTQNVTMIPLAEQSDDDFSQVFPQTGPTDLD